MNKKAAIFFRKQEESYELQGCEENHQTSIYQAEIKDTRPALGSRQDTTRAPNLTLNVSLPPCLSLLSWAEQKQHWRSRLLSRVLTPKSSVISASMVLAGWTWIFFGHKE
jgi:hypothetical protein